MWGGEVEGVLECDFVRIRTLEEVEGEVKAHVLIEREFSIKDDLMVAEVLEDTSKICQDV